MNRSDDAGETWSVINSGLAVTQFHGNFAMDQTKLQKSCTAALKIMELSVIPPIDGENI
ncbi:MAG: hypothetical protein IPM69_19965 [Ignavibacteria bacterium]|nr:hypothetical protein [Ignavibacteria bacterium]